MESARRLAPCFIDRGTISDPRDMLRALETLESVEYAYEVDGSVVTKGVATLVKLMADPVSATLVINGCLFVNVTSFRYLDFESLAEEGCSVRLCGDGAALSLRTVPDAGSGMTPGQLRLMEECEFDLTSFVTADDEDDDD